MTLEEAQQLDATDPLAFARERFRLPDGVIYLDGNSLGALPAAAAEALRRTAEAQWGGDFTQSLCGRGRQRAKAIAVEIDSPLGQPKPLTPKGERIDGVEGLGVVERHSFGRVTPFCPIYLPARSA